MLGSHRKPVQGWRSAGDASRAPDPWEHIAPGLCTLDTAAQAFLAGARKGKQRGQEAALADHVLFAQN